MTQSVVAMQPSNAKAAGWMAGWLTLMLVLLVAGREATRELNVFQIMEMRSVIGLLMLYPLIHVSGGLARMKTSRPLTHIVRNIVHYAAQYGWFLALTLIPLAQVVAIEFTMPIWTALLAVSFIGERLLIMVLAAMGFGAAIVMVKSLTRTDTVLVIIFWMLVIQSAIGLVPAVYTWHWPSAHVWPWILVIAFCGPYSHYCFAQAMRYADATVVVPMDFLRVPLSATLGWLLYSERLDAATVVGAALILTGNLLNLKRSGTAAPAQAKT